MGPTVNGLTLSGMNFDGNQSKNTILSRWELHSEIYLAGDDLTLVDLIARNAQGEGYKIGGRNVSIRNISSINSNGNGIHFSGISQYVASNLKVVNANLLGTVTGHADGGVIWSNNTEYGTIDGIYVENAIAGLGSLDSPDNSNMTIRNVIVINCSTIVDMRVPGVSVRNISIENLVSRNDHEVAVIAITNSKGLQPDAGPQGIVLRNWKCENARLVLRGARDVQILGCQFKVRLASVYAVATVESSEDVTLSALLQGGRYGLATSALCRRVTVRGMIVDNLLGGVLLAAGDDVLLDRLSVVANLGRVDSTKYIGIVLGNRTRAIGGRVKMFDGVVGVVMPLGDAAVSSSGAVLEGMIVATPPTATSVKVYNNSAGNLIRYCRTTKPIQFVFNGLNRIEQNNLL